MSDDKTKRGGADRARVSGEEAYEVAHFADKHGLSREEAREIIERSGGRRAAADAQAERMKALKATPGGLP